jgi:hypothetical protein
MNNLLENNEINQKKEYILIVFTYIISLIIIIYVNFLITIIYQVDEQKLLAESSRFFLDKFHFGLWPEPIERIQYLITIILAPLTALFIFNFIAKIKYQFSEKQINIIYYLSFLISAYLILLLIYLDLKLNPDNFIAIEDKPYYRDIRNFINAFISKPPIYMAILSLPIVIYFMNNELKFIHIKLIKIIINLFFIALIFDLFLISLFNRDNYFGGYDHFNAVYYSVGQVVNGKTLLVDFTNQYGLYPHFLQPIFKIIGLNVLNYSIIMGLLVALSYLLLLLFMKNIINNNYILFLGFVGLVYLRNYFLAFFNYGDNYFQYTPIRFIFPCLFLLFASFYLKSENRFLKYLIYIIASISILWNIDSGIVVFVSWIALLCFKELYNFKLNSYLKNCFFNMLNGLIICTIIFIIYGLLIYFRSGYLPDYYLMMKSQKIFYLTGFYMMHMPLFNAWNLVILIYGIGIIISVKSIVLNQNTYRNSIIFLLTVIGLGLFSYYQGRSHDFNLFSVLYPAIILLIILADGLVMQIQAKGFKPLSKLFYLSLILFFLLTFFYGFISKYKNIYQLSTVRLSKLTEFPNEILTENIAFIKQNTRKGEDVLILTEDFFDGIYYAETGTRNVVNVPGYSELMLHEDYNKIILFLSTNDNIKVFINSKYSDKKIHQLLLKNYVVIDKTDEMIFYLPKNLTQTPLIPIKLFGFAHYHLITSNEALVKNLDNFPTNLPLAKIHVNLSDSTILNSISISALNNIGNNIGNWTTKPISHLWGIGVIDTESVFILKNNASREYNLNLPINKNLILLVSDNGNLSACPPMEIKFTYNNYQHLYITAKCK